MNVLDRLLTWLKYEWNYRKYQKVVEDEKEQEIENLIKETRTSMYTLRKFLIKTYGSK